MTSRRAQNGGVPVPRAQVAPVACLTHAALHLPFAPHAAFCTGGTPHTFGGRAPLGLPAAATYHRAVYITCKQLLYMPLHSQLLHFFCPTVLLLHGSFTTRTFCLHIAHTRTPSCTAHTRTTTPATYHTTVHYHLPHLHAYATLPTHCHHHIPART